MGLSRLAAKCQACPFVDTCDHKEMEALGFLTLPEAAAFPTMMGVNTQLPNEVQVDADTIIKEAAKVFQIPERMLRGEFHGY